MSSTEPPSRIPPRQQPQETKAARDELSSKGKVEKVREVDPDEEARKKKFMQYYKGLEEEPQETRPTPFDLYSGKTPVMGEELGSTPPPGFSDVEDAIVPGPTYTPPPDVHGPAPIKGEEDDEATTGILPQSEEFWDDFDLPDQPISSQTNYREMPAFYKKEAEEEKGEQEAFPTDKKEERHFEKHKKRTQEIAKKEKEVLFTEGKVEKKKETHKTFEKQRKVEEPSPFGPPGKPAAKKPEKKEGVPLKMPFPDERRRGAIGKATPSRQKEEEKNARLHPSFENQLSKMSERQPPARGMPPSKTKQIKGEKEEISPSFPQEAGIPLPIKPEEKGGEGRQRPKEEKILEIEPPSLPRLPTNIQPMAMTATTQATPYLTAATVSLFYQMVGTMYVMSGPQGVNRTEISLNNPAYANSKFYGSIITIEKYATAPDSFNIRLTGSHEAVATFKENISSLLTAFQNGNFPFRVNRLDVEYTLERPIFRRKEKSSEKGEAGGGDLGGRRNQ